MERFASLPAALALAAATLCAQSLEGTTTLDAPEAGTAFPPLTSAFYTVDADGDATLHVQVYGLSGPRFQLEALLPELGAPLFLGEFPLDGQGQAALSLPIVEAFAMPENLEVAFRAIYVDGGTVELTPTTSIVLNAIGHVALDFDAGVDGVDPAAGAPVGDQWSAVGLDISGDTPSLLAPDMPILFDSDPAVAAASADPDLATPGYGPNNVTPLGKLLVLAADDVDADLDGLVDAPAAAPGVAHFDFAEPTTVWSVTVVDADPEPGVDPPWRILVYSGQALTSVMTLPSTGDNGVLDILFVGNGVTRLDVEFATPGAVGGLAVCPTQVNFDKSTFGVPLGMAAGTIVTDQLASQGVTISAANTVGSPNMAILFDSANRTGGDFDLVTPGPGIGNDESERLVLIIAEDAVDANGDGLIDDPDDDQAGGDLRFDFAFDVELIDVTVLDVDGAEISFAEGFDQFGESRGIVPFAILGDNSKQDVFLGLDGVRQLVVHFGGSGAVTHLVFCPDT